MEEKRQNKRTSKKILVCFEGDGFSVYSKTKDVSDSGAFISTHYLLNPGTEIKVKMDNPSIERNARVVRLIPEEDQNDIDITGFGVEFI